jgi:hypothetical protein
MLRCLLVFIAFVSSLQGGSLLFRAGLTNSLSADFAAGDREPLVSDGVSLHGAAMFPPTARLTYDARANMYAEQGTVVFWWRPDQAPGRLGFPLFNSSYEQHGSWDYTFARIDWTGSDLSARVRDRNLEFHSVRAPFKPVVGKWEHLAMTWSEAGGIALYLNGKLVASMPGPFQFDAGLDQFGFLTHAVTPHHTAGGEEPGSIRDARIYRAPLSADAVARLAANQDPGEAARVESDWRARFGWGENAGIPAGTGFRVRRVPVREAMDLKKLWLKATDGKRDTLWPTFLDGFSGEGKVLNIYPEPEAVNYLRTTGSLKGRISGSDGLALKRSGDGELVYYPLPKATPINKVTIERETGALGEVEFLNIQPAAPKTAGSWLSFAPTPDEVYRYRRDPETFVVWKPGKGGAAPAGARYHLFSIPVTAETGVKGVNLRLASAPGTFYHVAVQDPVNVVRDLIEAEFRSQGKTLDLALEFPDVVVPAGKQVVVVIACSNAQAPRVEAQLATSELAEARKHHVAQRIVEIRDSFQMLCEARPWMMIGRNITQAGLRRQLKLVDELYTLLEDVRRIEPNQPTANAYWGWMNRYEKPPAFEQPKPADPSTPLWAFRQLMLVKQFRQVVDWWIDNRQIENGEMGGDLNDDTDLIQNWAGVGLLDGPSEKYKKSARAVSDACHNLGRIKDGFNSERMDALHAYEEGINSYGPAFLLDYGNPVLAERMMQTAQHYSRIMGINNAGHRHFRSIQYSTTDVVEEGYHAREDMYSHLILHPGLYLAWYNGSPSVTKLLTEYGDSLLAHWKTEQYPRLARGIFFADDHVENRAAPFTDVLNIFWGLYDITGDERYLWVLRRAVEAGDLSTANGINGRWFDVFQPGELKEKLAAEVAKRKIHDHNLQTDQWGTVARAVAWQAGGDLSLVEDEQAALIQHMSQNMYLYTDAQQYDDRIWIPMLSTQRERLGGVAHYRNYIYPGHAVSWENTGGEVAFLVPAAKQDSLRVVAYNTGAAPRRVRARVWQLENGRYEVAVKDSSGAVLSTQTMKLKRYSPVDFEAPAKQQVTVEFRQLSKLRPVAELPDLAIAREEMRDNGGLEVTVHNIGGMDSRAFKVTVRDASGKVLGESKGPALAAPDDLKPKTAVVRFPGVGLRSGLRITVIQDETQEEICDENNEVVIR